MHAFLHSAGQHGRVLDFNQRLEIAIDVAHALTYLHLYAGILSTAYVLVIASKIQIKVMSIFHLIVATILLLKWASGWERVVPVTGVINIIQLFDLE